MPDTFNTELLSERLARLGAFTDVFAADGFQFAEMRGRNEMESGVLQMPWSEISGQAMAFHQLCFDNGWVVPFDWGSWKDTPEAIGLRDEPNTLFKATPEQIPTLLTTLCARNASARAPCRTALRSDC